MVSGVRRVKEVNPHQARLVCGWISIPSRYVTSQLGQLSLASLSLGSFNRVPALAGARAGMSPLLSVIPYGM